MCAPADRGVARPQPHRRRHETQPAQQPRTLRLQQVRQTTARCRRPPLRMARRQHRLPRAPLSELLRQPQPHRAQLLQRARETGLRHRDRPPLAAAARPRPRRRQRQAQLRREFRQRLARRTHAQLLARIAPVVPLAQPARQRGARQPPPAAALPSATAPSPGLSCLSPIRTYTRSTDFSSQCQVCPGARAQFHVPASRPDPKKGAGCGMVSPPNGPRQALKVYGTAETPPCEMERYRRVEEVVTEPPLPGF